MTNFEKWKDKILELTRENRNIALLDNKVVSCFGMDCHKCGFSKSERCHFRCMEWLFEEADPSEPFEKPRSCKNCDFDNKGMDEHPCVECSERYELKFKPKSEEPELKPCLFCGGDGRVVADGEGNYTIQCNNCAVFMGWFTSREKVIEAWNRRADK